MSAGLSPLEQIKNLGKQVAVPVFDPLTKTTRNQLVNVFDSGAPPFPGKDPISNICNNIQAEIRTLDTRTGEKTISKPSVQPPDLGKDRSKENSTDVRTHSL
jgi:hypothetical protein